MTQFYLNTEAAIWNSLVDEDNKLATIYKQYQLTTIKRMMDEDLRSSSCGMWLFVVKNEGNVDRIPFAWSRNLLRSEQRNSNYTHNQKIK